MRHSSLSLDLVRCDEGKNIRSTLQHKLLHHRSTTYAKHFTISMLSPIARGVRAKKLVRLTDNQRTTRQETRPVANFMRTMSIWEYRRSPGLWSCAVSSSTRCGLREMNGRLSMRRWWRAFNKSRVLEAWSIEGGWLWGNSWPSQRWAS